MNSVNGIYVGNLSCLTSEESLGAFFQNCGTITRLFLPRDSDKKNRGYAFIDFADKASVAKACALAAQSQYLDGFEPYIRPAEEEHNGISSSSSSSSRVRFGCMWDLVMMWDEPDPEVICRNLKAERELFAQVEAGINFDKYDSIQVVVEGEHAPPPLTSFNEVDLHESLKMNVARSGYIKPTPIQKYSIPIGLAGKDLMACAQTGSGKTAAFLIPCIQQILTVGFKTTQQNLICPHTLILVPTRELTAQIAREVKRLSYQTFIKPGVITGGKDLAKQVMDIDEKCAVLIATPGRLIDLITRGKLTLQFVKTLILDEADRMLDMGFEPQIRQIVEQEDLPPTTKRQTMMFSATFPGSIRKLAQDFLNQPVFVSVGKVGSVSENVTQQVQLVEEATKDHLLVEVMEQYLNEEGENSTNLMVIFVKMKRTAWRLEKKLKSLGFLVASIHGDKSQKEREEALESFKTGEIPFLLATDVAARGLDIPSVNYVLNYDLPDNIDDYIHRIGRTARAGRLGFALSFYSTENAVIARSLTELLTECGKEVPSWLLDSAKERFVTEENFKGWDRVNFSPFPEDKEKVFASVSRV